MAWMALLVICTVTPEQSNGWQTGGPTVSPYESPNNQPFPGPNSGTARQPTTAPIVPDYAPAPTYSSAPSMPPSVMSPPPSAPATGGSWWTQIQDALASPVTRTPAIGPSGASNAPNQMRQVSGSEYPPTPPPVAQSTSGIGFPSSANQNEVLPPGYSGFSAAPTGSGRGEVLPPGAGSYPNSPPVDPGPSGRDVLYEGSGQGSNLQRTASYQNRTFVTAPRVTIPDPPPLQPPINVDTAATADSQTPAQPLPTQPPTNTVGSPTGTQTDSKSATESTAGDRWWPLLLAMLGLFGSLGFNVYLGWIAWDLHGRYQDVVADLHDLENQFDERTSVSESDRSVRRESRRVTALAG